MESGDEEFSGSLEDIVLRCVSQDNDLASIKEELTDTRNERDRLREQVEYLTDKLESRSVANEFSSRLPSLFGSCYHHLSNCIGHVSYYFHQDEETDGEDEDLGFTMVRNHQSQQPTQSFSLVDLRVNIARAKRSVVPFASAVNMMMNLVNWSNPIVTLNVMMLYFILAYYRYLMVTYAGFLLLFFLGSFLEISGWNIRVLHRDEREEEAGDVGLRETLTQAKLAALRLQVFAGQFADTLEKLFNFFRWEDWEGATRAVHMLLVLGVLLLTCSCSTFDRVISGTLGVYVFVAVPLFNRFPRLKRRLDLAATVWKRLPNNRARKRRLELASTNLTGRRRSFSQPATEPAATASAKPAEASNTGSNSGSSSSLDTNGSQELMSPTLRKALEGFGITGENQICGSHLRKGVLCHHAQKTNFALPLLVLGRVFLTENYIVFVASAFKKDSFKLQFSQVTNIQRSLKRQVNLPQSITLLTANKTFVLAGIIHKSAFEDLFSTICRKVETSISR